MARSSRNGDQLPAIFCQGISFSRRTPLRDIGLAVGDFLGLRAGRAAEDDHAGAEAGAGVVEEGAGADQHALRLEIVNEGVMLVDEFLLRRRAGRPRLDDFVVDDPALLALAFAHDDLLPAIRSAGTRIERCGARLEGQRLRRRSHGLVAAQMYQEPNMNCSISIAPASRATSSQGLISGLPSMVRFISHRLNGRIIRPPRPGGSLASMTTSRAAGAQQSPGVMQHREVMRHGVVGQAEHHAVERLGRDEFGGVLLEQIDVGPSAAARTARAPVASMPAEISTP